MTAVPPGPCRDHHARSRYSNPLGLRRRLVHRVRGARAQHPSHGIVTHDLDSIRALKTAELGAGFARITARWWQIEPTKGAYVWNTLDDYVWNQAAPRNIQLFVSLGEPPAWAGGGPTRNGPPTNAQDWYDFVHAVVSRYGGYVKHWGVWNEPNLPEFLSDRDRYHEIAYWAHAAIKSADPAALVVGPEVSEHALDDGWFASVMASYGRDLFDIVTVHVYTGNLETRMDTQVFPWRFGKPVWLTETGLQAYSGVALFEQVQRAYYTSVLGVFEPRPWWWKKIFFYDIWSWDTAYRFGICAPDWRNHQAFEAYRAYIAAHPSLNGPTDSDGDGLPNAWEFQLGLDALSTTGVNGAGGDADADASRISRS